ncbi:MAG TPA: glycoside hydrolase family 88 protein [Niabella sp.]|nr:glycoside hydrolase family 88 protein [Niabella sp.]HQW16092.1 glycoside hydrolase family 88 protein [Niabella sp.]HQX21304.1 glycoside hydrolase family 88 protein [Niabella sp.]HQX42610.1 glycoside hydrolase family 88 protein [Niabella sp.]HRB08078.1 glycoside hydrolase family 88 protein [Niabella sp.]
MNLKLWQVLGTFLWFNCAFSQPVESYVVPSKKQVMAVINKPNNYWQKTHTVPGWAFWDQATYHTGNMAAFEITNKKKYKRFSEKWAEQNNWMGATSTNKKEWKYSYGETNKYVLFGDWQVCFQTYIDLYNLDKTKKPAKIARAKEVMEYQMSTPQNDYWWWADGLYMVMPVMSKLYHVTGNPLYLQKLWAYFEYANSIMYDADTKIYYRDAKYIYPKHKTISGKKDFWARGNGWVVAALAKVLTDLPENDAHRQDYINKFIGLAQTIKTSQQPEGYWTRSMLDPQFAPGPETSGTAFFTYGLLWGINHGLLDKQDFEPTIAKAWQYLTQTALQKNGKIGFVQPIGEKAIPGQVVNKDSTAPFGVGAFLLAATEMYKYVEQKK